MFRKVKKQEKIFRTQTRQKKKTIFRPGTKNDSHKYKFIELNLIKITNFAV